MNAKICWRLGYSAAILFFFAGAFLYYEALRYTPKTPEPAPPNHYNYQKKESMYPMDRYALLSRGELFFGKTAIPEQERPAFHSNLKILGIIEGQNSRAVVGLKNDPERTWIVKPGSVIEGEKIVKIGKGFILVRNESGEGKVERE